MKSRFLFISSLVLFSCSAFVFTACNDDDDDDSTENHNRTLTVENITTVKDFVQSGVFTGAGTGGTIQPGQQIEIKFNAGKGQALSLATMYGNSKDLFFGTDNPGIQLFTANGTAVTGDVSAQVKLWDNGTIANSDPSQPATGQTRPTEDKNITEVAGSDGVYIYPAASDMMKLTLAYNTNTSEFTLTIRNNSNQTSVQTPFSAGVWAVSNILNGNPVNQRPFYIPAQKTTSELTALATQGNNQPFATMLEGMTGTITTISPVLVVVYTGDQNPIFRVNEKDGGIGLKNLAQTGDATVLKASLERERAVSRVYVFGTAPAAPGSKIEGQYTANGYEKVAFATMFGYSNDWFYANNSAIDALDNGDKTNMVSLYDSGTAVSQYPGAGNAGLMFTNTPITESENIKVVNELTFPTFKVPAVNETIKVTIH